MAKITIESINEELEQYGWSCVSETYKNLETELEFLCEEGHTVCAPWKKIRTRRECPRCKENKLKEKVLKAGSAFVDSYSAECLVKICANVGKSVVIL